MATQRGIDMAMDMFMATFNKKPEWKDSIAPVWTHSLDKVKDKVLWDSMMRVCTRKWKYPPTLGHVIEEIEAVIKEMGGSGLVLNDYKFCENCIEREGIIEVAYQYLVRETGKLKAYKGIARCTCTGAKSKFPVMQCVEELYTTTHLDGSMTIVAWHQSNGCTPFLSMRQREPHNHTKMLQHMAEKKAEGIPNPYEKYVELITQGIHVPPDAKRVMRFPTKPVQPVAQPTTTHYNNNTDPDDCIW